MEEGVLLSCKVRVHRTRDDVVSVVLQAGPSAFSSKSAPPSFTQASESQAVESCESFLLARCSHNFFGPVRLSVTGLFEKKIRTSLTQN